MGSAQRGLAIVIGSGFQPPEAMLQQFQVDGQFAGCTQLTAIEDPNGWFDAQSYEGQARAAAVMHARSNGFDVAHCQIVTQYGDYPRFGGRFYLVRVIEQPGSAVNVINELESQSQAVIGLLALAMTALVIVALGIAQFAGEEDTDQSGGLPAANHQVLVRDGVEPDAPPMVEEQPEDGGGDDSEPDSEANPGLLVNGQDGSVAGQTESSDDPNLASPKDEAQVARAAEDDADLKPISPGLDAAEADGTGASGPDSNPKPQSIPIDNSQLLSVGTTVWKGRIHDTEDKDELEVEVELTREGNELNGRFKVPAERTFLRVRGEVVGEKFSLRAFEKSGESRTILFPFTISGTLTNDGLDGQWFARRRGADVSGRFELQPDSAEP